MTSAVLPAAIGGLWGRTSENMPKPIGATSPREHGEYFNEVPLLRIASRTQMVRCIRKTRARSSTRLHYLK